MFRTKAFGGARYCVITHKVRTLSIHFLDLIVCRKKNDRKISKTQKPIKMFAALVMKYLYKVINEIKIVFFTGPLRPAFIESKRQNKQQH